MFVSMRASVEERCQDSLKIRRPILTAYAGAFAVLLVAFFVSVQWLHQVYEEKTVEQTRESVIRLLDHIQKVNVQRMRGMLTIVAGNPHVQALFMNRDRQGLLSEIQPLFEALRVSHLITHLYFSDVERINFLRVHKPALHGDRLDRPTTLTAAQTGQVAYGLDVGPLGTFALRVVLPWRVDGQLIGYLELGMDALGFLEPIRQSLHAQTYLFLEKAFLDRQSWNERWGIPDWDRFPAVVWAREEGETLWAEVQHHLQEGDWPSRRGETAASATWWTDHFLYFSLPLVSSGGHTMAWLGVARQDAEMDQATRLFQTLLVLINLLVTLALGWLLYRRLGQMESRLCQTNEALRRSENRTRAILDTAMDAIISMDAEGRILEFNRAAERIFGYGRQEVLGRTVAATIIPEELRPSHQAGLSRFLATREPRIINHLVEQTAMDRHGHRIPMELAVTMVRDGEDLFFTAYLRDVHERRQMVASLQESYAFLEETNRKLVEEIQGHRLTLERLHARGEQFRSVTESITDAIIAADEEQRIFFWNDGAREMFGFARSEILGQPLAVLIPQCHQEDHRKGFEAFLREGRTNLIGKTTELVGQRRDGHEFPMEIAVSSWLENGRHQFSAVIRDITDRQQTARSLREAIEKAEGASQAKSQFLSAMSHEIRTPMNAIIGMCELLSETEMTPEARRYLTVMKQAGDALLALINDILDLSKIEAGQMMLEQAAFDLAALVTGTVDILRLRCQDKGLALTTTLDENLPGQLLGDPQRLRQILLNLLSNAIKFTQRGHVAMRVSLSHDQRILFEVADTGIGIAHDKQEIIFQPFIQAEMSTSRRFGGTGLGLTICWKLIQQMKGHIWVESEPGQGSVFRVLLPLPPVDQVDPRLSFATRQMERANTCSSRMTTPAHVLLVDDADDNRLLVRAFLKQTPYHLDEAIDGQQCLDRVRENRYDLILMDMQMPVIDGFEATRQIRRQELAQNLPPMPIIALTAHAMREDVQKTAEAGCTMHMTKPITKNRLLEAMAMLLESGDAENRH